MSAIDNLMLATVDRLTADAYFTDLPIVAEAGLRASTATMIYEDEIANGLNEQGLFIGVPLLVGKVSFPNLPQAIIEGMLAVDIYFDPHWPVTPGRESINEIIEHIHAVLHLWAPLDVGQATVPVSYNVQDVDGFLFARLLFSTAMGVEYDVDQVADVTFTYTAGSTLTLACITAGASVFYTLNGVTPTPATGTQYTTPLAVVDGDIVKARAYLAGLRAGNLKKIVVDGDSLLA